MVPTGAGSVVEDMVIDGEVRTDFASSVQLNNETFWTSSRSLLS